MHSSLKHWLYLLDISTCNIVTSLYILKNYMYNSENQNVSINTCISEYKTKIPVLYMTIHLKPYCQSKHCNSYLVTQSKHRPEKMCKHSEPKLTFQHNL